MSDESIYENIGHWKYDTGVPTGTYGFIYCITNTVNNKKYIGKKQLVKIKKLKPLKGKKNKRHFLIESDWREYTGSCNDLNMDIKKHGKQNFKFDIIRLCDSKWEMAYYEAKEQFEKGVLESDEYYNGIINLRIGKRKKNV